MSKSKYALCSLLVGFGLASGLAFAREARENVLLVIPARYTVVQFAFDMARIRPVSLVAYEAVPKSSTPVLHIWDGRSREWVRTSIEAYQSGALFGESVDRVVFVGRDPDLPASVMEGSAWADKSERISSLNVADLANGLHKSLKFTPGEWQWLARRYGLSIEDQNVERRRYGKYGKPGAKKNQPPRGGRAEAEVTELESMPVQVPAMPATADGAALEEAPETTALAIIPAPAAAAGAKVAPEDK